MATHSSILASKVPWREDPGRPLSMESQRTRHDWATKETHNPKCKVSTYESILTLFSSLQSLSHVQLFVTPWNTVCQASLSITNSRSPPKPMSIELVMLSDHLILCWPFLLLSSIFPSIRVFSNESALHIRWPKDWSCSFNITPSSEHPGLIPLGWTVWMSIRSKGLSRLFSNTTVQKHQFFGTHLSLKSNSHIHICLLERP